MGIWFAGCVQETNSANRSVANAQANVAQTPLSATPATSTSPNAPPPPGQPISIATPVNDAQVIYRETIRGTIADPKIRLWVIVRPMKGSEYWVQPSVDVDNKGQWSVQSYIGQSEAANIGEHFKIMAVAKTARDLKEGEKLNSWPEAKWQSQAVEVVRK